MTESDRGIDNDPDRERQTERNIQRVPDSVPYRQQQAETDRERQSHTETAIDRQRQTETDRE